MTRHKKYNGPQSTIDPVRDFLGTRPFSSGPEGFTVNDIDGCFVLHHFGTRFGTDNIGQIRLIEWKHANPFQPAQLGYSQNSTFGLLDRMLKASNDDRYCGFLIVTCNVTDPADQAALVYVQRLGTNKVHGPMNSTHFAQQLEKHWTPCNSNPDAQDKAASACATNP